MAIIFNKPFETTDTEDLSPDTINSGNSTGEQEDVGTLTTDYVDSDSGDMIFVVALGADKDARQTKINLNTVGLDSTKIKAVINFINVVSRGTVKEVYRSYMRHKNLEMFDTLPLRAIDDEVVGFPFKVYLGTSARPTSDVVWVPYVNQDMTKSQLLAEINKVKTSLGFGASGSDNIIREISVGKTLITKRQG